ncbi:hypothetical protein H5410_053899 [Solanum commersonii]|uniref:Uncharacterized protein n=1 Tax=Solanum commersonii TaxID=4109 RepID=A0A9J5X8J4_SOLCO|nr:hypothetical protein H5410_053899 [Solanum commersonii]
MATLIRAISASLLLTRSRDHLLQVHASTDLVPSPTEISCSVDRFSFNTLAIPRSSRVKVCLRYQSYPFPQRIIFGRRSRSVRKYKKRAKKTTNAMPKST